MIKTNNTSPVKKIDRRGVRQLASQVWRTFTPAKCDLSLTFVPVADIVDINARYLHRSFATDVIAFNLGEGPDGRILADIYICPELAAQNAKRFGVDLQSELARLVIHGVLHLVGYEDQTVRQRNEMRVLEDRFLRNYVKERQNGKK